MNKKFLNQVILGNSEVVLKEIASNSIDVVLTDPPYFLDRLDNHWEVANFDNINKTHTVKSLPPSMRFSRRQGVDLYNWYLDVSKEIFRILKPGGFFFSFSSPRLYHRMACAVDDAGFEIRDAFIWLYTNSQAKAMSLDHIIKRRKDLTDAEKAQLIKEFDGWKTAQIKSMYEPIVIGQKPLKKTNLDNMLEYEVGLMNTSATIGDGRFPANVMSTDLITEQLDKVFLVSKPTQAEKGLYNTHKTVKPVSLCRQLIKLTVFNSDGVILDPFLGSGTTAVAAILEDKNFIGIESQLENVEICLKRIEEAKDE